LSTAIGVIALVIAVLAVVAVAGGVWFEVARGSRPDRVLGGQVKGVAVVTMDNGETFRGVLDQADRTSVALLDAEFAQPKGGVSKVDGRLILPRASVRYVQIP
jgi:hypothetical protein